MRKSRLSKAKQRKLVEFFVAGSTARTAAAIVNVNKTTASYYFKRLRELITDETQRIAQEYFEGEIEDAKSDTLMPIIREKIIPDSIVYTDCLKSYNVLDVSEFHHHRINHFKIFADKKNHINGIENFWNQSKRHMRKFNGIKKENFIYFLKECEWRFNNPNPKDQFNRLYQFVEQNLF